MANEKPPLGVAPHWFVYPKRIIDLSEAITRYADYSYKHTSTRHTKEDYVMIYQWAWEIARLAEIMANMEESDDGK